MMKSDAFGVMHSNRLNVNQREARAAFPSLLVAAAGSGAGKTVTTMALLCALRARGIRAVAAKSGPDYIDAGFHATVTDAPVANLDVWMSRAARPSPPSTRMTGTCPAGLTRLFSRLHTLGDMALVEGAMGLFDGATASAEGTGSAAHLAILLGLPVLLLIHAGGMGQSVAAVADGFLRHRPAWLARCGKKLVFAGLVCTHVGGEKHKAILRAALKDVEADSGVTILGMLPREGAPFLASRHLGLVEARDAAPALNPATLTAWLETNCNIDALLKRIEFVPNRKSARKIARSVSPQNIFPAAFFPAHAPLRTEKKRVAIARDAAFSFCYADLPALLAEIGAESVFFSPLADAAPPPCDALYFPGGYPELHARELANNKAMLGAVRGTAERGTPVYGECGGYIYLMRSLRYGEANHVFSGLLPLACILGERRAALGYRAVHTLPGWPERTQNTGRLCDRGELWARGHEFHYGRLADARLPADCAPLWRMCDSEGRNLGREGCRRGSVAGSWVHLYPEGAKLFWKTWLCL
jgi:cobyrinic acid a,c-diamide synthase